jgi:hypothetical protein
MFRVCVQKQKIKMSKLARKRPAAEQLGMEGEEEGAAAAMDQEVDKDDDMDMLPDITQEQFPDDQFSMY